MSLDRIGSSANWMVWVRCIVGNVEARVVKGLMPSSSLWAVDIAVAARNTAGSSKAQMMHRKQNIMLPKSMTMCDGTEREAERRISCLISGAR